ncbi:hypothetical protein BBD46_06260 [Natrialba sp. SSL1]|nr:hypothetical protein BBD46_06260 [Natrialba sp. SSL1]
MARFAHSPNCVIQRDETSILLNPKVDFFIGLISHLGNMLPRNPIELIVSSHIHPEIVKTHTELIYVTISDYKTMLH